MADESAMRFEDVGKRFRRREALRDCSFVLPRGRVAALVGPNGAGKTTLLMLATGLLRPDSGRIDVLGADPARSGMPVGASFLAQDKPLYRAFRVAEMLRAAAAFNAGARWDAAYAAQLVREAGIGEDERIRELSAGQRARVALAVALGRRPELLLLDEPLSELDPLARRQVMGTVLAEAAETGMTVLLSSHVLADLEESCDHLVLLREGRVRLSGGIDALLAAHHVVTGPASPAGLGAGVIHQSTAGRQTTALVRAAEPPQGFRADPATLDALVLAYLQQTMPDDRGRAA